MIVVISGPGGVGKGTIVSRLLQVDSKLWLSRSWTTRLRRAGEDPEAYEFVDRDKFERHIEEGGFLEWAEFLGNLYGTPYPGSTGNHVGKDLVLEIDVQGAAQVLKRHPGALLILVVAPSPDVQRRRLMARGDPPDRIARRIEKGTEEIAAGEALGAVVVVNDDLDTAVADVECLIEERRAGEG